MVDSTPGIDTELLDLAEVVLREAGYSVEPVALHGMAALLAEDPDGVVALTGVLTVNDVFAAEPLLSRAISDRSVDKVQDSKRWDCYSVVITSARADPQVTDALFSLAHNLKHIRRLIRVGVDATKADVARSLRPVLPLYQGKDAAGLGDPLVALQRRLVADGLDESDVNDAIVRFRVHVGTGAMAPVDDDPDLSRPG